MAHMATMTLNVHGGVVDLRGAWPFNMQVSNMQVLAFRKSCWSSFEVSCHLISEECS